MPFGSAYNSGPPPAHVTGGAGGGGFGSAFGGGGGKTVRSGGPSPVPKSKGGHGLFHDLAKIGENVGKTALDVGSLGISGATGLGGGYLPDTPAIGTNLVKDIGSTAYGIIPGLAALGVAGGQSLAGQALFNKGLQHKGDKKLERIAKGVVKSYEDYYGHNILHHLNEHPLQPILDALTIATAGAGSAAKAGSLLSKAGVISDESRLAQLGERATLATRSPRAIAKGKGPVIEDISSNRPLVKGREVLGQAIRQHRPESFIGRHFPGGIGPVGSEMTRYGHMLQDEATRGAMSHMQAHDLYVKATKHLTPEQRVALHVRALDVHPSDILASGIWENTPDGELLKDPKIREFIEHPETTRAAKKFARAEADSRLLSAQGQVLSDIPDAIAARQPTIFKNQVSELLGRPAREITGDPYYFPHVEIPEEPRSPLVAKGAGRGPQRKLGSMKKNEGKLSFAGRLALSRDLLGPEFLRRIAYFKHSTIHEGLLGAAQKLTRGELEDQYGGAAPHGYEFIRDRASQRIPKGLKGDAADEWLRQNIPNPERIDQSVLNNGFTTAHMDEATAVGRRTIEEYARKRLAKLERDHEGALEEIGKATEGPIDLREALRRGRENAQARRAAAGGKGASKAQLKEMDAEIRREENVLRGLHDRRSPRTRAPRPQEQGLWDEYMTLANRDTPMSANEWARQDELRNMFSTAGDTSPELKAEIDAQAKKVADLRSKRTAAAKKGGPGAGASKGVRPSLSAERRARAEQRVEDAIARNPEGKTEARWRARTDEIDQLRAALGHSGDLFDPAGVDHGALDRIVGDRYNNARRKEVYYAVPKSLAKAATGEFTKASTAQRLMLSKPLSVWRSLVLGTRVGFLSNNLIGNHLMYGAKVGGRGAIRDYFKAVIEAHGRETALKLLQNQATPPDLRVDLMKEFFPEHGMHGQFGGTASPSASALQDAASKVGRGFQKTTGAIPKFTAKVAEEYPRRALLRNIIRNSPEFRRLHSSLPRQTRRFEDVARQLLEDPKTGKAFQRRVSKEVDQALGNYWKLNPFERNVMRNLLPFYSWYKAIVTTTAHLAVDTPLRANLLGQIGRIGRDQADAAGLGPGDVPSYLLGAVGLGKGKGGAMRVLSTQGLNPWATLGQLGRGSLSDIGSLGINPFVQAALDAYAKGTQHGNTMSPGALFAQALGSQIGLNLPPLRLIHPPGGSKLYPNRNFETQLWANLGLPIKEFNPAVARDYAQKGQ